MEPKKTQGIKSTSGGNNEAHLRLHLKRFHSLRVSHITSMMLQRWVDNKVGQGMNIETFKKVKVTLNQVLNFAVLHKYIEINPLRPVKIPKVKREADRQKKMNILSPIQVKAFFGGRKQSQIPYPFFVGCF